MRTDAVDNSILNLKNSRISLFCEPAPIVINSSIKVLKEIFLLRVKSFFDFVHNLHGSKLAFGYFDSVFFDRFRKFISFSTSKTLLFKELRHILNMFYQSFSRNKQKIERTFLCAPNL